MTMSHTQPALIGESAPIQKLRAELAVAARTDAKVLLVGDTGVGKEVAAQLIHQQSARCRQRCVAVNCSGIPETLLASELFGHARGSFTGAYRDKIGLVRQADRGTLFLDELGEMSLAMQATLLRFTETGEIQAVGTDAPVGRTDVRLIAATNRNLLAQIAAGAFREDLYYRLNVIRIDIPPLKERGDDVLLLLDHYLSMAAETHRVERPTLTADAAAALLAYRWPGNVRELRNLSERLVLRYPGRSVSTGQLPSDVRQTVSEGTPRRLPAVSFEHVPADANPARPVNTATVQQLWDWMEAGEDFWTVVHQAFKARELTRAELTTLVDRGLRRTDGSYRALLHVFHLRPSDYKRFLAFLRQHHCNLPVGPYRMLRAGEVTRDAIRPGAASDLRLPVTARRAAFND